VRKQPSKRGDEGTIGGPQLRTLTLASRNRKLMPKQHEFDVFRELGPSTPNEQPQYSGGGKVSEGEEHRPILPGRPKALRLAILAPASGFWYARARVNQLVKTSRPSQAATEEA
jgi:hypothetical protein